MPSSLRVKILEDNKPYSLEDYTEPELASIDISLGEILNERPSEAFVGLSLREMAALIGQGNPYQVDLEMCLEVDEQGRGLATCLSTQTGDPIEFPTSFLEKFVGKPIVLNDPVAMTPLLTQYGLNPWKMRVEAVLEVE
jgi:hypothetical protein